MASRKQWLKLSLVLLIALLTRVAFWEGRPAPATTETPHSVGLSD